MKWRYQYLVLYFMFIRTLFVIYCSIILCKNHKIYDEILSKQLLIRTSQTFSLRAEKNKKMYNSKAAYRFCMSYIKSSLFDNQSKMQNAFLWKMPNFISKLVVIFCLSYRHIKSCCIADSLFSRMPLQLMLLFLNLDALCL